MTTNQHRIRARLPFWACTLIAVVLMFANYIGLVPLQFAAKAMQPDPTPGQDRVVNILACLMTLATSLVLVALASRWVLGRRLGEVGWRVSRDSWWLFGLGWAAAAAVGLGAQALACIPGLPIETFSTASERAGMTGSVLALVLLAKVAQAIALQGIPEELVWRGWLMNCLQDRPCLALVVSAVVFGALHVVSNGGMHGIEAITYLLQAMAFAFLAGALALRMRSLWCAIGVHGGMHLTNLALGFAPRVADGSVLWVAQAAGYVVLGLLVLRGWQGDHVVYDR